VYDAGRANATLARRDFLTLVDGGWRADAFSGVAARDTSGDQQHRSEAIFIMRPCEPSLSPQNGLSPSGSGSPATSHSSTVIFSALASSVRNGPQGSIAYESAL
jgi:hypothetical protein